MWTSMVCFQRASQRTGSTTRLRRRSQSFTMTSCVPLMPTLCLPWCCWISPQHSMPLITSYRWRYWPNDLVFQNLALDWFQSYHTGCTQTFTTPSGSSIPVAFTCSVPQGSVISPKEFIMYTENIKKTIDRFIINHHLWADDSQLLAHMQINAVTEHCPRLGKCVESLQDWCSSWRLQLNPDKTELIWFGSRVNLVKLRQLNVMILNLCSVDVEPVNSVRDFGVILDSELSMRVHISKILSICFFHLRRLRKLRPLIDTASAQCLVSAFILSRVDYCNAVLASLPTK